MPDDVEYDNDRSALDAICSAVPEEMVPALAEKDTAKEAWEAIRTFHIGDNRVRKATAQNLHAEYEAIKLKDRELIEDFALRLTGIVQQLASREIPSQTTRSSPSTFALLVPSTCNLLFPLRHCSTSRSCRSRT